MAHVNYGEQEDLQNDTFKIISQILIDAILAYREHNLKVLHTDLDIIYLFTWNRLPEEEAKEFEKTLSAMSNAIHGTENDRSDDGVYLSQVYDEARELLKKMTKVLDDQGILWKIKADLDRLVE